MAGVYIHIPFCKQACHYCDFHFSTQLTHKKELLEALNTEILLRSTNFSDPIETIYFGGGTPSILKPSEIIQLISQVRTYFDVIDKPEITIEANPDDLNPSVLQALSDASVNRLSIGVQSFDDRELKMMNRAHNADQAHRALEDATVFFQNISIDLIYGMPESSEATWQKNIEQALSYEFPHISSYALTIEPKTALDHFVKKEVIVPLEEEKVQVQYQLLVDQLDANQYVHYELSSFGKEGYFSKNNTAYWKRKTYIGIGPSAHSFDGQKRSWNVSNNAKYIQSLQKKIRPFEEEILTKVDQYNEYIMTGLRTMWGVSLSEIRSRFGVSYAEHLLKQSNPFVNQELVYWDQQQRLKTTSKGSFLSDGIASSLFLINL